MEPCVQNGDSFDVKYIVTNTGNEAAPSGTAANLCLEGLYGDLKEKYGVDDEVLVSEDISGLAPGAARTVEKSITLPVSVFKFCGYDAVTAVVKDAGGTAQAASDQQFITLDAPIHLALNGGSALSVDRNATRQAALSYESTVFMNAVAQTVYSIADPGVASVDESGNVTGLSDGTTTLTATILPSGRQTSIQVTVNSKNDEPDEPETPSAETVTVAVSGDEGSVTVSAAIDGDTAAVAALTQAQLAEITDRAGETGTVTVDLSGLPENITAAAIPAETVKAIDDTLEAGGKGLAILLPGSAVTFDADALRSVAAQAAGDSVTLNVTSVSGSELNDSQKTAAADLDVLALYDIYLTSGDQRITDFGGGQATVTVKSAPDADIQPGGIVAWYLADGGEKTKLPTRATETDVSFTVPHFSIYALSYDKTLPGACPKDDSCPMGSFDDLDKALWYHDGVHWALDSGVMNGVGHGAFDPGGDTSRAMLVTMLWRMEGQPTADYEMTFTDVPENAWYTEAVRWAAACGIVTGYNAETFGPSDPLTREQLAAILCRYAGQKGVDTALGEATPFSGFVDTQDVSDWAIRSLRWAVAAGIVNGVGDSRLSPKAGATRAQVATMLMRYVFEVASADDMA